MSLQTLDHDDKQFIELMGLVVETLNEEDVAFAQRLLATVEREMRGHFRREEALFIKHAYPGCARHREGHGIMLRSLKVLGEALEAGDLDGARRAAEETRRIFDGRLLADDEAFQAFLEENAIVIESNV